MNHQPYETWILDEHPVSDEHKIALEEHLKTCPECVKLKRSWVMVEKTLISTPVKQAPARFVNDWKGSLAARKRAQEKKQARTLLISLCSGGVAIMIALAALFLPEFSLISVGVGFVTTLVQLLTGLENFWSIIFRLSRSIPVSTIIITGVLISSWIILACLAWGLSIWKLAFRRGLIK